MGFTAKKAEKITINTAIHSRGLFKKNEIFAVFKKTFLNLNWQWQSKVYIKAQNT